MMQKKFEILLWLQTKQDTASNQGCTENRRDTYNEQPEILIYK